MTVGAREAKSETTFQVVQIATATLKTEKNIRSSIAPEELGDLAKSISQDGVLVPLLARVQVNDGPTSIVVIDGHRRLAAALLVELKMLPVILIDSDSAEAERLQLVANVQRAELHPMDEARVYQELVSDSFNVLDVAVRVGKSEKYVRQRLVLANLIDKWEKLFRAGKIAAGVAFLIARQTQTQQKEMYGERDNDDTNDGELSIAQVRRFVEQNFQLTLKDASWDLADATLFAAAGPCTTCPKRTGNAPALFDDVKSDDTCTDPKCYNLKLENFIKIELKNKDTIKLTVSHGWNDKPQGTMAWSIAGKKVCDSIKRGVVVQNTESYAAPEDKRKLKVGSVLEVCTNQSCKIHVRESSSSGSSRGALTPAEKKKRAEHKRSWGIAQLTHRKFTESLLASDVETRDLRAMVCDLFDDYSSRPKFVLIARAILGVEKFEGKTPFQQGSDAQERLLKWAMKASETDLIASIVALRFTPFGDNDADRIDEMLEVAGRYGVKAAAIEKVYDAEHAPKLVKETKPKKAKSKK